MEQFTKRDNVATVVFNNFPIFIVFISLGYILFYSISLMW